MRLIKKQYLAVSLLLFVAMVLFSCKVDYVELKETTKNTLSDNSNGLISKEVVTTPTINFDEIFSESTENEEITETIEATRSEVSEVNIDSENVLETEQSTEAEKVVSVFDLVVDDDDRTFKGTLDIDPTVHWQYGMTPCEWVYIEPGIALISNYRPNSSAHYSIKAKVSSGLKGCYVPVFTKTDMLGNDFDARLYVFEDYSKEVPSNMLFSNTLSSLKYKDRTIEEILMSKMNLTKTDNGLLREGSNYINIIYVTDLDKLLEN